MKTIFKIISFLFFCLSWNVTLAQSISVDTTASDTTVTDTRLLDEVTVTGYDTPRKLIETAGSVSIVEPQTIQAYDETSVVPALNTVPGVRMEERAPGSYRIAIRGSSLRSPFGVRNVKVYWNDIPFTDPTGSTALNLLDVINMESIEVVKGPAGSIYGAGTGGVLNINSTLRRDDRLFTQAGATVGSYGLRRYTARVQKTTDNQLLSVKFAHQEADGYRDHSALDRNVLELSGSFDLSDQQTLGTHFLYSDLDYQIPGGLTLEQFQENPRQARPGNQFVMGSEESEAGVRQKYVLLGLSHEYRWSQLSNKTTLYGDFSFFENPFLFDYKRDSRQSGGGRTRFYYDLERVRFTLGGEFQSATNVARNFGNDQGQPDTLNFDDEIRAWQGLFFANAEIELPANFLLTVGLSHNRLNYDIYRLADVALDSSYRVEKSFDPVWIPRVGLVMQITPGLATHASVSYGFSPPTIEEIRTNEGSISLGLSPERGVNYELGVRGSILDGLFNVDLTGFYFELDETIVQQQSERGTALFTNAGSTDQAGLELGTTWFAWDQASWWVNRLEVQASYTHHYFVFNNYVKGEDNFSGNRLTGVAPNILVLALQASTASGFYLNGTYNFTDEIPLNDANSVYADSYHLVQGKLGYRRNFAGVGLDIFGGVDNLLNQTYSLGNDINAFGERYYQPAAQRNFYVGLKLGYQQ